MIERERLMHAVRPDVARHGLMLRFRSKKVQHVVIERKPGNDRFRRRENVDVLVEFAGAVLHPGE